MPPPPKPQVKPQCEIGPNPCCIDILSVKSATFAQLNAIYYNTLGGYQWTDYMSKDALDFLKKIKKSHLIPEVRIQWHHPNGNNRYKVRCTIRPHKLNPKCFPKT